MEKFLADQRFSDAPAPKEKFHLYLRTRIFACMFCSEAEVGGEGLAPPEAKGRVVYSHVQLLLCEPPNFLSYQSPWEESDPRLRFTKPLLCH